MRKILALILARKGSKRLKNKNRLILKKKPMFYWSIKSAENIKSICDILISTDDKKIYKYSKKLKCLSPWIRPKAYSTDRITSAKSAIHAIDWYEKNIKKIDGVLLLQPTSPFRKRKTIIKAIRLFYKNKTKTIVSMKKHKSINKPTGGVYLIAPNKLRKIKNFTRDVKPFFVNDLIENIDINLKTDFIIAKRNSNRLAN
tara:strand:+ start:7939 stop:8538 length:600 start_codon:yes stop_codon:yes gene_type:complete